MLLWIIFPLAVFIRDATHTLCLMMLQAIPFAVVNEGLCVPNSCSSEDVTLFLQVCKLLFFFFRRLVEYWNNFPF